MHVVSCICIQTHYHHTYHHDLEGWSVTSEKCDLFVTASITLNRMVSRLEENIVTCALGWRGMVVVRRCGRDMCFLLIFFDPVYIVIFGKLYAVKHNCVT